jgi:NAD(P)-dependent dehydrogenase (short-subunit alcohol dehydrogenase family)
MATLMGKKVVVVGGSSGIGLGVATGVETVTADMAREAEIAAAFAGIGAFDHLVSTAGAPPPGDPIADTKADEIRAFVDNKLIGAVLVAKHAARKLKSGGSMTFTSGINKDRPPVPGGAVVSAIAGSFSYFARALSLELAPTRVNIVSPGWVDTPMFDELVGEEKAGYFEAMAARLPIGRIATPADVAPAYLYAMESDFTTGETIHIDGGQRLI